MIFIVINVFVGGMVGLEWVIFFNLVEVNFYIVVKIVIFFFIFFFGLVKVFINYLLGWLVDCLGWKKMLVVGWFIVILIFFLFMYVFFWSWVVFVNILLGIN